MRILRRSGCRPKDFESNRRERSSHWWSVENEGLPIR